MSNSHTARRQRADLSPDVWVTCPADGKRSYSTRWAADRAGARIPGPTRSYRCGDYWHLTSTTANSTAYLRGVSSGRRPRALTRAELEDLDPQVYDLRAAGRSMASIAAELHVTKTVVARILRQHDPLAVPGRRIGT